MSPDARPRSSKARQRAANDPNPTDTANAADASETPSEQRRSGLRPMWSGAVTFGLVTVPVELHSSVRSTRPRTRMLGPDGTPLQRRYRCAMHDRLLEDDEIVRGYPIGAGRYVTVADAELEALAPERSGEIALLHFVEHDALPLPLIERTLYMAPKKGSAKAYRLLATVMERAGLAGIVTFVMRGHQKLGAIVASGGVLRVELLRFDEELRKPDDVGLPPAPKRIAQDAIEPMREALRSLYADELDLRALHDEREDELERLAEQRLAQGEGVVESTEVTVEQDLREHVVDLMKVLRQRIEEDDAQPPAA
jgi:DNA end-binding protein Ku